jgi:hypothetical protein
VDAAAAAHEQLVRRVAQADLMQLHGARVLQLQAMVDGFLVADRQFLQLPGGKRHTNAVDDCDCIGAHVVGRHASVGARIHPRVRWNKRPSSPHYRGVRLVTFAAFHFLATVCLACPSFLAYEVFVQVSPGDRRITLAKVTGPPPPQVNKKCPIFNSLFSS